MLWPCHFTLLSVGSQQRARRQVLCTQHSLVQTLTETVHTHTLTRTRVRIDEYTHDRQLERTAGILTSKSATQGHLDIAPIYSAFRESWHKFDQILHFMLG